jgi:hypothetical protein
VPTKAVLGIDFAGNMVEKLVASNPMEIILPANGALTAGDFVNIFDYYGNLNARRALADAEGKEAHGFVLEDVDDLGDATVICGGINDQLSGLAGGPYMYLSATVPGGVSAAPPDTVGHIVQIIGWRLSDTKLHFQPQTPIELA